VDIERYVSETAHGRTRGTLMEKIMDSVTSGAARAERLQPGEAEGGPAGS